MKKREEALPGVSRQKLLDRAAHRRARPVERTEIAVADGAVRADDEGRRQDARPPRLGYPGLAIEEQGKAERHLLGEIPRDARALAHVYPQDHEGPARQRGAQLLEA